MMYRQCLLQRGTTRERVWIDASLASNNIVFKDTGERWTVLERGDVLLPRDRLEKLVRTRFPSLE